MNKIIINLKPSPTLAIALTVTHFIAILCLVIIDFNSIAKIISLIGIAVSLYYQLYHYVLLKSPRAVTKITLIDGVWLLTTRKNQELLAKVHGELFLSNYVMLFGFKLCATNSSRKVPIFFDGVINNRQEIFRQVKVYFVTQK